MSPHQQSFLSQLLPKVQIFTNKQRVTEAVLARFKYNDRLKPIRGFDGGGR